MGLFLVLWMTLFLGTGCGINHASGGQMLARFSKGDGPREKRSLNPGSFDSIRIQANGNITMRNGDPGVVIEGSRNQLDLLSVRVEDNVLHIEPTEKVSFQPGLDFTVSVPRFEGFSSRGIFELQTSGSPLNGNQVTIEISGSGNYSFHLNARHVSVTHNGFGNVTLVGLAESLVAQVNATGSFNSQNLLTENANVQVSGVGGARVYASEYLEAKATGIGSIKYRGNPIEIVKRARGVGRISPID